VAKNAKIQNEKIIVRKMNVILKVQMECPRNKRSSME